ncbi:MAG: hypothetical protein ACHQ7M_07810, partial [Chloroflexota bacterium]
ITFRPGARHTHASDVALPRLPAEVPGLDGQPVPIKDGAGRLACAVPVVSFVKSGRYADGGAVHVEPLVAEAMAQHCLAGIVAEGGAPSGSMNLAVDDALMGAVFSGLPVVKVGRGYEGFASAGNPRGFSAGGQPVFLGGSNLTATKARLLLMAGLLKFGALPRAVDPSKPTVAECAATLAKLAGYQTLFDSH